jgi:circadian clock protein KaiC
MCDNIILLRYADHGDRIGRTLTVLKTRASEHRTDVREYVIDAGGITILPAPT